MYRTPNKSVCDMCISLYTEPTAKYLITSCTSHNSNKQYNFLTTSYIDGMFLPYIRQKIPRSAGTLPAAFWHIISKVVS